MIIGTRMVIPPATNSLLMPKDPVNHDSHYDPGHGTRPPKLDDGVDPKPSHGGPHCGVPKEKLVDR